METMVEMLAERIDIDEGSGTEPDPLHCDISHDLHTFLENKGGDTWQERKEFFEDLLTEMRKHKEEQNPGETQDTTDARITLQLQQGAMEVQKDAECTGRGDG